MNVLKFLITCCLTGLIGIGIYCVIKIKTQKKGFILLMSGPSSSGKTTLSRNVQKFFAQEQIPFLYLSGDSFVAAFSPEYANFTTIHDNLKSIPAENKKGLAFIKELKTAEEINKEAQETTHYYKEPLPYKVVLHEGELIKRLSNAASGVLAALSDQGINVILDAGEPAYSIKEALKGYPLALITLTAETSTLEEREDKNPTTRTKGLARERNKLNFTEGADFIIPNDTSEKDWAEKVAPNEIVDWILNNYPSHFSGPKD